MDDEKVQSLARSFERWTILILIAMMVLVIAAATVDLGYIIVHQMLVPPRYILLDPAEVVEVLGAFLMVLIALELLETVKIYLQEKVVHVEVVLLVAIVAIARKVIILDVKHLDPMIQFGIAAIIAATCVGYYFLRKGMKSGNS